MARLLLVDPAPSSRDWIVTSLRGLGHFVTGLTPVGGGSGLAACDEQIVRSFLDPELEAHLSKLNDFDGVVVYHQAATTIANRIAHSLDLPPLWADPTLDLRDKAVTHEIWRREGLAVPERVVRNASEDVFPVVAKPRALQGQIGVRRCDDPSSLEHWLSVIEGLQVPFDVQGESYEMMQIYGLPSGSLVQRMVVADEGQPYESSAEFYVINGLIHYLGGFDKSAIHDGGFFHELALVFPEIVPRSPALIQHLQEYLRAVGAENGLFHLEYKVVDGVPIPIELNPRVIGYPTDQVLSQALTVSVPELLVAASTGDHLSTMTLGARASEGFTGFVDVYPPGGWAERPVTDILVDGGPSLDVRTEVYDGESLGPWESCLGEPVGGIWFTAPSAESAQCFVDSLPESVTVLSRRRSVDLALGGGAGEGEHVRNIDAACDSGRVGDRNAI